MENTNKISKFLYIFEIAAKNMDKNLNMKYVILLQDTLKKYENLKYIQYEKKTVSNCENLCEKSNETSSCSSNKVQNHYVRPIKSEGRIVLNVALFKQIIFHI